MKDRDKKNLSAQDIPEIKPIVASGRKGFRFSLDVLWSHKNEDISTINSKDYVQLLLIIFQPFV